MVVVVALTEALDVVAEEVVLDAEDAAVVLMCGTGASARVEKVHRCASGEDS